MFYDEYEVYWILLEIVAALVIRMINDVDQIQFAPIDVQWQYAQIILFVMYAGGGVVVIRGRLSYSYRRTLFGN